MTASAGSVIQPTGKSFDVLSSTAAEWRDGRIVEEHLFDDNGPSSATSAPADRSPPWRRG
jgi:hypothetical protein